MQVFIVFELIDTWFDKFMRLCWKILKWVIVIQCGLLSLAGAVGLLELIVKAALHTLAKHL